MNNYIKRSVFSASMNTAGTIIYYFSLWIITMIISKLSHQSYYDVGVFSIAMSYGNIFFAFAAFGVRGFQVSDIHHEYSDTSYYYLRVLSCISATIACISIAYMIGYRDEFIIAITLFMIFKAIDAYSDLFYGYSQVNGHLEYAGYSMLIKGFIIVVFFTILLIKTQNLTLSMISMVLSALIINIFYDQKKAQKFTKIGKLSLQRFILEAPAVKNLFIACLPLMLNTLIMPLIIAIPRLLIEKIYSAKEYSLLYGPDYGAELLGIYTSVTAPTVIISTFVSAAALPLIPFYAKVWQSRKLKKIVVVTVFPLFVVALCTILGMPLVLRFGGDILGLLYTTAISGYVKLLVIAVIVSSILACVIICNNMLIVMRNLKTMLVFSVITCLSVIFVSTPLIKLWGIDGAAYTLGVGYAIQLMLQIVFIGYNIFSLKKLEK